MAVARLKSTDSYERYLDLTGKKPAGNQGLPKDNSGDIKLFTSNGSAVQDSERTGGNGVRRTTETNIGAAAGSANAPTGTVNSDPMSMNGSLFSTSPDGGVIVPMGPTSNAGVGSVLGASGINQPSGAEGNDAQGGATGGHQRGGLTGGTDNGTGTVNDITYSLYEQAIKEAKDAEAAGGGIFGADSLGGATSGLDGGNGVNGLNGTNGADGTNPPVTNTPTNPNDGTGDVHDDGTEPNPNKKPEDDPANNSSKGINNQEEKRVEQERAEADARRRLEAQRNPEEEA